MDSIVSEVIDARVVELYSDYKYSVAKLAKLYNCSQYKVRKILRDNNVSMHDNRFYQSKEVNENFFDVIDTEQKTYILGFIYADGCLTKGNALSFSVSDVDKEILEKIRDCLGSNHNIGTYESHNGYKTSHNYCKLSIVNKHLHDTLVSHGATERKTKTLTFPKWLSYTLVHHFIRGFF